MALILLARFITTNLFLFYVFFEMRLIPILLIIIIQGRQPERLSAGAYLVFYTTAASIPYLFIILVIAPALPFWKIRIKVWRHCLSYPTGALFSKNTRAWGSLLAS